MSRAAGRDETWTLRLRRGEASAELVREKRRARATSGTTVFVSELDSEASRVLTQRKVVEYMRRRRRAAIAAGAYELEVVEGRTGELVTPDEPAGLPIPLAGHDTLWGKLEFALYVAGDADAGRHVAVVGRAGTTIIDDLTDLEEFDHEPWTSGHLSGRVSFEPLRQSAGRRAILRDDEIYPVFRDAVRSVEPVLTRAIERVRRDLDVATAERLGDALRQVFGRVLRELADLDNPMRTLVGDEPDAGVDGIAPPPPRPGSDERSDPQPSIENLDRSTHRLASRRRPARAAATIVNGICRPSHPTPRQVTGGAGSMPTRAPCSTTSNTPTSSWSRTTRPPSWTISPRSSPRSTSSTTTHAPTPTNSPRSSSACSSGSADTSPAEPVGDPDAPASCKGHWC